MTAAKQIIGRTMSRLLRLPPHTTDYEVHHRVRVPMRDGVELVADHYRPLTSNPAGTLLVRGPYGRGYPVSVLFGAVYASRGYHVVVQSVRGTFGSGGDFDPFRHEITDGADTAAWLRDEPWFTGTFATIGASYLGFTQWALLTDPPPEMAAAVITVGPHDISGPRWGTGSFGLNDFLGWSHGVVHQEHLRGVRAIAHHLRATRKVARATAGLPVGQAGRTLLGDGAPWYESWLEHPEHDDPFWAPLQLHAALDRTEIPVLLLSGWQDLFIEQTLAQYAQLRARGVPVAVTIGPWNHSHMLRKGAPTVLRETLAWLGTHLAGNDGASRSPVRIHVNGAGWIDLEDWPPPMPEQVRHLQPGGRLGDAMPPDTAPASTFTYDPADPTPTIGGRLLSPQGGYRNDTKLARAGRRAELHRRCARAGPLCRRNPGARTVALVRQPPQRSVRPGERGGRQGAVPQCQRRISPRHTDFGHRHDRVGCGRTPVPCRIAHQGAGRRRLASEVHPQPRQRRTVGQRRSAGSGHPHRARRRRRVTAATTRGPAPA